MCLLNPKLAAAVHMLQAVYPLVSQQILHKEDQESKSQHHGAHATQNSHQHSTQNQLEVLSQRIDELQARMCEG